MKPTSDVSSVPNTLGVMLKSLQETFNLKSWQVYSERDGLNMKIRFSITEDNVCEVPPKVAFVRKSPSQLKRDDKRTSERLQKKKKGNTSDIEKARSSSYLDSYTMNLYPNVIVQQDEQVGQSSACASPPLPHIDTVGCTVCLLPTGKALD